MKQRKITFITFFISLLIISCLHYSCSNSKNKQFYFDKHIVDAIHLQNINPFFEKADAYKYAQDYTHARTAFEDLLPKTHTTDDSIYILNQLASITLAMNEDSLAAQYIQKLETLFPHIDSSPPSVLSDYFYNKGVLSHRVFHPKEAALFLQKALVNIQKVYPDDHLKTAQCFAVLGIFYFEFTHSLDTAFSYLPKSYNIFQKNKNILRGWSSECLLGMSIISRIKRQFDEAIGYCEEGISIAKEQPFVNNIVIVRCLIDKARTVNMRRLKASKTENKQRISREIEAYFQEAANICPKNSVRLQECYYFWTRYYARLDSVSDPLYTEHFWQTMSKLEQTIQTQGKQRLGFPSHAKAFYYDSQNSIDSALINESQFTQLALKDTSIIVPLFVESIVYISRLNERQFNKTNEPRFLDSALYYMKLQTLKDSGNNDPTIPWSDLIEQQLYYKQSLEFVALSYDSQLFYKKYQRTGDLQSLDLAIKIANLTDALLFTGLTSQDDDAFDFFQNESAEMVYSTAIQSSAILYKKTKNRAYLNDVFHFGERVRSFLLYRDADARDTSILSPRQSLKDSIKEIEATINSLKWATERGESVNINLMQKQNLRESLYARLKKDYPQYVKLKVEQPIPNINTVQQNLNPYQWFIQYTFSDSILNILFVSQKDIYLHQTVWNTSMDEKFNRFCQYLANDSKANILSPQEYAHLGFELYQKLLPQLPHQYRAAFSSCQELIISPDRSLNLLPFEALVESDNDANFKTMPYLAHCFSITYAPSWKIYNINKKIQLPLQPKIKAYTYNFESKELKSAKAEMANITRIFSKNSVLAIGNNCSKKLFMADKDNTSDILHLSLHAESDPLSKYNNKIYFAPKRQDTVYGFDLLKRPFNEKLIVLSACQSAYGMTKKGEGTYALSRIFLRMGVPHLIASLWSITDAPTEFITTHFYENLIYHHLKPVQALHKAKQQYIQSADTFTAQPRLWAGLVYID